MQCDVVQGFMCKCNQVIFASPSECRVRVGLQMVRCDAARCVQVRGEGPEGLVRGVHALEGPRGVTL